MIEKIKENRKRYKKAMVLAFFVVILLVIGVVMQARLDDLLQDYTEKQVTRYADVLAELTDEKMNTELRYLENISIYIEHQATDTESMLAIFDETRSNFQVGLLELGGNAVYGESLSVKEFSGIQDSFRGYSALSYSSESGLLFTVPVYSNGNVRYVLYELYENSCLAEEFGITCYEGKGTAFVVNRDNQVVIPTQDGTAEAELFLMEEEIETAFHTILDKMNVSTAAAAIYERAQEPYYLFMAEIGISDLILTGIVADSVVSEGITYITVLIWWVYGLLLVLLAIGMFFLFGVEEKAMESEELRKAKMLADSANKAKRDFLANMSHEIRTPINAVLGMNEMIIRECQEKNINQENIREYALNMQNANRTLLALINDILDFSKIEAGKMEIVEASYYFSSLLNDVINMIQLKAKQKNLEFFVKVDENLPNVLYGDEVRIRQVMVNILNNAVKYTNEGQIQMFAGQECLENGEILLKIRVNDTGIGIHKEDMDRLFGDFERLDLKKNRNVEGTGLGLAITSKLVELMNGTLQVESIYGLGSTFTITLPQKVMGEEKIGNYQERFRDYAKNHESYKRQFIAPDAKILVVDDNSMNLFVVEKLLQKTKVQVITCINGEQCLQKVKNECYDVILLDHMMPGMDGIETLKKLKKMDDNQSKDAIVIALTANAIVGAKESYIKEGFDDYLSKPIDGLILEKLLGKYIPKEKIIEEDEMREMELARQTQSDLEQKEEDGLMVHYDEETGNELIIIDGLEPEECEAEPSEENENSLLNREVGLRYSMDSEEIYVEFLEIFCSIKDEKVVEITESYEAEDWKNYNRLVHALKSTSKSIGGIKLSDSCYELEKAARENESDFIHAHHKEMIELFEKTVEEALVYLENAKATV